MEEEEEEEEEEVEEEEESGGMVCYTTVRFWSPFVPQTQATVIERRCKALRALQELDFVHNANISKFTVDIFVHYFVATILFFFLDYTSSS